MRSASPPRVRRSWAVFAVLALCVAALGAVVTAPGDYPVTAVLLLPLAAATFLGARWTAALTLASVAAGGALAVDAFDGFALVSRLAFLAVAGAAVVAIAAWRERHDRILAHTEEMRTIEAAAARAAAMHRAVLASLQDGLLVTDGRGVVVEVNAAWERLTGYNRADTIGMRPPYVWWPDPSEHPAEHRRFEELQAAVNAGRGSGDWELVFRHRDGRLVPTITSVSSVRDGATLEFVVGSVKDVTERAAIEARLRVLGSLTARLATENSVAGVAAGALAVLLPACEAPAGALLVVDPEEGTYRLVAGVGLTADAGTNWARVPIDFPGPVRDAVETRALVEIPDAVTLADRYPAIVQRTTARGMQALAALPLVHGGTVVGVIVAGFRVPRVLSTGQRQLLEDAAPTLAQSLERARLFEFQQSVASALQHAMLSVPPASAPDLVVAARYRPAVAALEVGGDWFDTVPLGDGRLGIMVGDIVGHGLAAAAAMGQLRSALGAIASTTRSPAEAVEHLDRYSRRIPGAQATTVLFGIVDPVSQTLRYTIAGHPPPLLVDASGATRFLDEARGWPLGVGDPARPRPEAIVPLPRNHTVLFYTDGLMERRGEHLDRGMLRLAEQVAARVELPVEQLCDEIIDAMVPDAQADDVALIAVRAVGADTPSFTCREPATPGNLALIRSSLRHWLERQGYPDDVGADVLLAVGEACTNAVEHAYDTPGEDTVVVEAHRLAGDLVVTVRDHGAWRPRAPDPSRNRGLRLIAAVMDEVRVTEARDGGTRVSMRRTLDRAEGARAVASAPM